MNKDKIKWLQELIYNNLSPLIKGDYALLDIPNHCNIGDNLIWQGEINFLSKLKDCREVYTANYINWDEREIQNVDTILFHGGGNWGDLYRVCQDMRNYVTSKYHNKRIIIFPQTVYYNNTDLIKEDCAIYQEHPDVHICVRDFASFDILSQYIPKDKLLLLPDMAFYVNVHQLHTGTKSLYMQRTDFELDTDKECPVSGCDVKDWPTYSSNRYICAFQLRWMNMKKHLSLKLQKNIFFAKFVDSAYGLNRRDSREKYINTGINFFSKYSKIYTTRLHGLILGTIMGKEMIIVDNKYNKCLNFYNTWLKDFDNIHILPSK